MVALADFRVSLTRSRLRAAGLRCDRLRPAMIALMSPQRGIRRLGRADESLERMALASRPRPRATGRRRNRPTSITLCDGARDGEHIRCAKYASAGTKELAVLARELREGHADAGSGARRAIELESLSRLYAIALSLV
jgi:hypothetical protein